MQTELTLLIAFGAGVLSFLSPCVLPLVPAYLGMLAGRTMQSDGAPKGRTLLHAVAFIGGFTAIFVALGASVALMGFMFQDIIRSLAFRVVAGAVLIVLGLHGAAFIQIDTLFRDMRVQWRPSGKVGLSQSFLVGAAFASGWTPCIGPILGSILVYAGTTTTVVQGALLLTAYSLGLGVPFLIAGYAIDTASRLMRRANQRARVVELTSGFLMMGMGIVVMTGGMTWFAGLLADWGFVGV